jgi:hypothetical protein
MEDVKMKYYAFISYKREDEKWARWVQRKLENYKLPAAIRAQDVTIPKYIRPIFRDNTDLSGTVLQDSLDEGLARSKYLILICSPNVVKSEWVKKEIQQFIDSGRLDHIVPFVVEGVPMSGDPATECFPDIIRNLPEENELLGVNVHELGKDKAIVRLISTLVGVSFDKIWDRHRRIAMRRRVVALCVALFMIVAGLFLWDYNRPTYAYFADYVDCYGVPQGIIPLPKSQVAHREGTYRFEYRRIPFGQPNAYSWRVSEVSYVNSYNVTRGIDNQEIILRYPNIHVDYYENGIVSRIICRDKHGKVSIRYNMSEHVGTTAAIADFVDSQEQMGTAFMELQITGNAAAEAAIGDEQRKPNIVRFAYSRDSLGHVTAITFHSNNDYQLSRSVACEANGIYGVRFTLDSLGRRTSVTFMDERGGVMSDRQGISSKRYRYDEYGNMCEVTNYDIDGHPVLNEDMWARRTARADEYGNICRYYYFGTDGRLCNNYDEYAVVKYTHNDEGYVVRESYYGTDGKPCVGYYGFATCVMEYGKRGYTTAGEYYDDKGLPCRCSSGYEQFTMKYDARGNATEICVFDEEGKPCLDSYGEYWRFIFKYDDRNNVVREEYYGVNNEPRLNSDGYAGCVMEYDNRDRIVECRFYDEKWNLANKLRGFAKMTYIYDARGNCINVSHYDGEGNLCRPKDEGFATRLADYDDQGNRIKTEYFGADGNYCANSRGFAKQTSTYDERGNRTETAYFDTKGRPYMIEAGYCRWKAEYDANGNRLKTVYYDRAGNVVVPKVAE